jgi:hypothetical protein
MVAHACSLHYLKDRGRRIGFQDHHGKSYNKALYEKQMIKKDWRSDSHDGVFKHETLSSIPNGKKQLFVIFE